MTPSDSPADFDSAGFFSQRRVLGEAEVEELRSEADRVAKEAGTACVRHLDRRSARFSALAREGALPRLLPHGMRLVRSLLFDKTPDENWPVAWHQDTTIAVAEQLEVAGYGPWSFKDGAVHVQPPARLLAQMISLRVHLDDTPPENGALRVIPGSHRHGRLSTEAIQELRHQPEVVCSCAPGDVLLMQPLILHASRRAAEPARRRVLHYEYAPGDALDPRLRWAEPDVT